jgi:hypothetical protein
VSWDLQTVAADKRVLSWQWADPDTLLVNGNATTYEQLAALGPTSLIQLQLRRPRLMEAGSVVWHCTRDLDGVLAGGIEVRKPRVANPAGAYVFTTLEQAEQAQARWYEPLEIVEVQAAGLLLRHDQLLSSGAMYSIELIEPSRLTHVPSRIIDHPVPASAAA